MYYVSHAFQDYVYFLFQTTKTILLSLNYVLFSHSLRVYNQIICYCICSGERTNIYIYVRMLNSVSTVALCVCVCARPSGFRTCVLPQFLHYDLTIYTANGSPTTKCTFFAS